MLVLSRRAEQQIVFPHLGIRINVLQVKGQLVKLGVDAPDSVRVLRNELCTPENAAPLGQGNLDKHPRDKAPELQLDHNLRNELNLLNLKIQSLQRRIDGGEAVDAAAALRSLVDRYAAMDHALDNRTCSPAAGSLGRPTRLLVVDDSDNERQLMAYLLASHGFDVQVAADGLLALDQLQATASLPDFVLMDMQMPFSNGLETLMQIRSNSRLRHLKVFAVTGVKRDPSREPIEHGWDGWFQKPLDVAALVARLEQEMRPKPEPQLA